MSEKITKPAVEMEGWLEKWTNVIHGYQKRWFVLQDGLLSYYRNPDESIPLSKEKISLDNVTIRSVDSCHFVISDDNSINIRLHTSDTLLKDRWVTTLEHAKENAIILKESSQPGEDKLQEITKLINAKLKDLNVVKGALDKQGYALQNLLDTIEVDSTSSYFYDVRDVLVYVTVFSGPSVVMIKTCKDYLEFMQAQEEDMLQDERDQRVRLKEMVEQLTVQPADARNSIKETSSNFLDDDEDFDILSSEIDKNDQQEILKLLNSKFEDLDLLNNLMDKHCDSLRKSLNDDGVEALLDPAIKVKRIEEQLYFLRNKLSSLIRVCEEYVQLAQFQGKEWQKMLHRKHKQRTRLEKMIKRCSKHNYDLGRIINEVATDSLQITKSIFFV